jgi:hypothetical protein
LRVHVTIEDDDGNVLDGRMTEVDDTFPYQTLHFSLPQSVINVQVFWLVRRL